MLVVEDKLPIANMVGAELRELGFDVVGPAYTIDAAEELARREQLCAAVMTFRLNHVSTSDLARELKLRGCPVLFFSGQEVDQAPDDLNACEWLQEPFSHEELALAIRQIVPVEDTKRGEQPCQS